MDSMKKASKMLFGPDSLGVKNIRFYPGTNLDATPEDRAKELIKIFERLKQGKFRVVK